MANKNDDVSRSGQSGSPIADPRGDLRDALTALINRWRQNADMLAEGNNYLDSGSLGGEE